MAFIDFRHVVYEALRIARDAALKDAEAKKTFEWIGMKSAKPPKDETAAATDGPAGPAKVSLRSIYADAMREVMSDPRKAIAEHDPALLTLVNPMTANGH
jgi:hypothetical protein